MVCRSMETILLWAGIIIGGLLCLLLGLAAIFWLGLGAAAVWQLSLIFIVLGGFIGGGVGAAIGFVLSGCAGLLYVKLMREY